MCILPDSANKSDVSDHTTVQFKNPESEGALKEGQLQPGDRVFTDQLEI